MNRGEASFILANIDRRVCDDELNEALDVAIKALEAEPKTGHWIDDNENEIDAQYGRHLYKCSKCNEYADMFVGGTEDWWDIEKPNYCPNCGCRMVEPQESEE